MVACLRRPLGLAGDTFSCSELNIQSSHSDGGKTVQIAMGLEGSCEHRDKLCLVILYLCVFGKLHVLLSLNYLILKNFSNFRSNIIMLLTLL